MVFPDHIPPENEAAPSEGEGFLLHAIFGVSSYDQLRNGFRALPSLEASTDVRLQVLGIALIDALGEDSAFDALSGPGADTPEGLHDVLRSAKSFIRGENEALEDYAERIARQPRETKALAIWFRLRLDLTAYLKVGGVSQLRQLSSLHKNFSRLRELGVFRSTGQILGLAQS